MTYTWLFEKKPNGKPLTSTQKNLVAAIKAAGTRTFDASAWNIRTVNALFSAGMIYVNCDGRYKTVALIVWERPACQTAEVHPVAEQPLKSPRRAHALALEAAVADALTPNPAAIAMHNAAYTRLRIALRSVETACCECCGNEYPKADLKPIAHEDVAAWFEESHAWDRDTPQCPYCRERWHYAAGYDFDWQAES